MKKMLVLLCIVFLSSCVSREDAFTEAMKNMDELDQLKMVVTIDGIPVIGNVTGTLTIDHDKQESLILGNRTYSFEEDNKTYYLQQYEEQYYRFAEQTTQDNYFAISSYSKFNIEDFEYDGGYYISNLEIDGMSDIYIKIVNGYINTMQFKIDNEDAVLDVKLEFINYGTATITLPEYIPLTELEEALFLFTVYGYEYIENSTGYTIENDDLIIEYKLNEDYYTIITTSGNFEYYPETRYIYLETSVSLDVDIYLSYEDSPILTKEEFETLDKLYNLE